MQRHVPDAAALIKNFDDIFESDESGAI